MADREIIAGNKLKKVNEGDFDFYEFERLMEKAYLDRVRPTAERQKKTFAPSSIGYGQGTCPRYWHMAFHGVEFTDKTDAQGMANMMNGTSAHKRLDELLQETGILVESETEMRMEDPPVFGYIDAIVEIDGIRAVGEIKTTRTESFVVRKNTGYPIYYHLYQILLYMKAKELTNGFLFYEDKNSQEFLVIPIRWNDHYAKVLDEALDWLRAVYKNYEESESITDNIPARPWTAKNINCQRCPLFEACWDKDMPDGDKATSLKPMKVYKP